MTVTTHPAASRVLLPALIPPLAALAYPFLFGWFHGNVIVALAGTGAVLPILSAGVALVLMFAVPIASLLCFMALAETGGATVARRRGMRVALLGIAVPPLHVFAGVVLYLLHSPVPLLWAWLGAWTIALAVVALADDRVVELRRVAVAPAWLRVAHGVSALAIVAVFLSLHLANHLTFILGEETYRRTMEGFRHIYRAASVEPVLVGLFLFQVVSGLVLVSRYLDRKLDRFRGFQIGSGFFLAVYVTGHMNSVFVYQRWVAGGDTDWSFATGAPAGLLESPGSIHLVPHYGLGVFFVLAHLSAALRSVMLSHGTRRAIADRVMIGGSIASGLVAAIIMLGMAGVTLTFALP